MNLRFTKTKVIGSIVITLIIWVTIFIMNISEVSSTKFFTNFLEIHNLANIFSTGNLFIFIVEIVVIYIIWSFFQRGYY